MSVQILSGSCLFVNVSLICSVEMSVSFILGGDPSPRGRNGKRKAGVLATIPIFEICNSCFFKHFYFDYFENLH